MSVLRFVVLLLFSFIGGKVTASEQLYLTGFCRSFSAPTHVATVEKLAREKADELAPLAADGSLVSLTYIPSGDPAYELWIVTGPSGSIASCSQFHAFTISANPSPSVWITKEGESDEFAPSVEATLFEQDLRCGTECAFDSLTLVVTGVRPFREIFIFPVQMDAGLESRACPLEFRFALNDVRLGKERVSIGGSVTGNIYCQWSEKICSFYLPPTHIEEEMPADAEGIFSFDLNEFPAFKEFVAIQEALVEEVCESTWGACDERAQQTLFERCVSIRSSQSFAP